MVSPWVFCNAANSNNRSLLRDSVCIFVLHKNYYASLIQVNVKQLQGIANKIFTKTPNFDILK